MDAPFACILVTNWGQEGSECDLWLYLSICLEQFSATWHQTSRLYSQQSCFVSGRSWVQSSVRKRFSSVPPCKYRLIVLKQNSDWFPPSTSFHIHHPYPSIRPYGDGKASLEIPRINQPLRITANSYEHTSIRRELGVCDSLDLVQEYGDRWM